MTDQRSNTASDIPEEVAAAIAIALESLLRPATSAPPSAWVASAKVAPTWQHVDRADLWQRQDHERGWRDR